MKKLLFTLSLVATLFGGASAQSQTGGAKMPPEQSTDVPILVMHLPDWEKKLREGATYARSLSELQKATGDMPALDAFSFDEGTEAATAKYEGGRLVVVEFPTPQHSVEADAAINARIAELRAAGQPAPSAYTRTGNYSVFVFDAPDAASAEQLLSEVKYEKDVRWLGRNPRLYEMATRRYTSTMGNVILTTMISTGVAILACLGIGGIIGGVIFMRRRAQQNAQEVYSDAGGMLQLNLEDLNAPHVPTSSMIGRGKK